MKIRINDWEMDSKRAAILISMYERLDPCDLEDLFWQGGIILDVKSCEMESFDCVDGKFEFVYVITSFDNIEGTDVNSRVAVHVDLKNETGAIALQLHHVE